MGFRTMGVGRSEKRDHCRPSSAVALLVRKEGKRDLALASSQTKKRSSFRMGHSRCGNGGRKQRNIPLSLLTISLLHNAESIYLFSHAHTGWIKYSTVMVRGRGC
jgi:hypothetical protein